MSRQYGSLEDRPPVRGSLLGVHSIEPPKEEDFPEEQTVVWRRRTSKRRGSHQSNSSRRPSLTVSDVFSDDAPSPPRKLELCLDFDEIPPADPVRPDKLGTKVYREPVTGKCGFAGATPGEDFCIVDLWERKTLSATIDTLQEDVFYFRARPLLLRTWLFTGIMQCHPLMSSQKLMGMCLAQQANDGTLGAHPPHSLYYYVPMIFVSGFTDEVYLMAIIYLILACCFFLLAFANTFTLYRINRLITIPLRLSILVYIGAIAPKLMDYMMQATPGSIIRLIGFVLVLLLLLADFWEDVAVYMHRGMECSYQIVSCLPKRTYVVRSVGLNHRDPMLQKARRGVCKVISGISQYEWDRDPTLFLVANIHGVVCFLFPMKKSDWKNATRTYCRGSISLGQTPSLSNNVIPMVRMCAYTSRVSSFNEYQVARKQGAGHVQILRMNTGKEVTVKDGVPIVNYKFLGEKPFRESLQDGRILLAVEEKKPPKQDDSVEKSTRPTRDLTVEAISCDEFC